MSKNVGQVKLAVQQGVEYGAHLVAFPKCSSRVILPKICSCKAGSLEVNEAVDSLTALSSDYPQVDPLRLAFTGPGRWYSSAALFHGGKLQLGIRLSLARMAALRTFPLAPGEGGKVISFGDEKLAVSIGEGALMGLQRSNS